MADDNDEPTTPEQVKAVQKGLLWSDIHAEAKRVLEARTYNRHAYHEEVWEETLEELTDAIYKIVETTVFG